MMHESCIVKNAKHQPRLLIIGGKIGKAVSTCAYTDSVLYLDIVFALQPYLITKIKDAKNMKFDWKTCKSMNNRRANFCHLVLDNMVYIFGGISGQSNEKKHEHVPKMPTVVAEKYDPVADSWEKIEIPNIMPLGAFAWTPKGKDSSEIIILGGTDGDVIQESMWTIDFKAKTAKMGEFEFEQTFAMNKLFYRPEANMLYSLGGYGSGGQNFKLKMEAGEEWEELERSHIALMPSSYNSQG